MCVCLGVEKQRPFRVPTFIVFASRMYTNAAIKMSANSLQNTENVRVVYICHVEQTKVFNVIATKVIRTVS